MTPAQRERAAYRADIRRRVDEAPPLSPAQRDQLRALLRPAQRNRRAACPRKKGQGLVPTDGAPNRSSAASTTPARRRDQPGSSLPAGCARAAPLSVWHSVGISHATGLPFTIDGSPAMSCTPGERRIRAQVAARARWATADREAERERAGDRVLQRFAQEVDPDGVLSPDERYQRAENACNGHMLGMRLAASRARQQPAGGAA
jgi:hypothetical protein